MNTRQRLSGKSTFLSISTDILCLMPNRKFEELKVAGKTDQECVDEIITLVRQRMEQASDPSSEQPQSSDGTRTHISKPPLERRPSKRAPDAPDVPTRRRSYDLLRLGSMDSAAVEKPQRKIFRVAENLIIPFIADSWESAASQPYCPVCEMAFKSESVLQRHINFSVIYSNSFPCGW